MTPAEQLSNQLADLVRASELYGRALQHSLLAEAFTFAPNLTPKQRAELRQVAVSETTNQAAAGRERGETLRTIAQSFQQLMDENTQLRRDLDAERALNRR